MANRFDLQITITTKKQGDGIEAANKEIESFGKRLNNTLSVVKNSAVALLAAGAVFKKAFDFAAEGAQLEFLEDKFESLAASIDSSGDVILEKLNEVTKGTLTTAQQMELASQLISLGLATTEEDVTRLAKVVTGLGLDMSQVILTFANNSVMRLDALGLSVTDVKNRAAALEAQGLDANKAFDTAVLEAAEAKLLLVGSAADSSAGAYIRLQTQVAEATDEFKRQMAEGLTPWIQLVNGDYAQAITNTIENNIEAAQSIDDLGESLQNVTEQMSGPMDNLLGTNDDLREGFIATARALAVQSGSWKEFSRLISENTDAAGRRLLLVDGTIKGFYDEAIALENLANRDELAAQTHERHLAVMESFSDTLSEHTIPEYSRLMAIVDDNRVNLLDWTGAARTANRVALENARALSDHTAPGYLSVMEAVRGARVNMEDWIETGEQTKETAEAIGAAMQGGLSAQLGNVDTLFDAYEDLAESQGEWVQGTINNNQEIADAHTELMGDLDEETRKGYQDILAEAEEGGAEWIALYDALQGDLTESQRNALIRQIADLQAHHGEVVGIYTGDAVAAEEARTRIDEALAEIALSYAETVLEMKIARAGGVFTQDAADFAVAAGIMSQAEADYRLLIQQHYLVDLPKLEEAQQNRLITEEQLATATGLLATRQAANAETAILMADGTWELNRALGEAYTKTTNLKDALLATEGDYDVNLNYNINTIGEIPQIPGVPASGAGYVPIPTASGGYRPAGSFILAGEQGPEMGVLPQDRYFYDAILTGKLMRNLQGGGMGGGGRTYVDNSQTTYVVAGREAAALILAEAQVSRRRRLDSGMGI